MVGAVQSVRGGEVDLVPAASSPTFMGSPAERFAGSVRFMGHRVEDCPALRTV